MEGVKPLGNLNPWHTTKASMDEFLLLFGLQQETRSKNKFNCEYNNVTSLPRNILATKVPPGFKTCVVMFKAANNNCACTYSSMSCKP